jgi:hypothetical protein
VPGEHHFYAESGRGMSSPLGGAWPPGMSLALRGERSPLHSPCTLCRTVLIRGVNVTPRSQLHP